jgi:transketolase
MNNLENFLKHTAYNLRISSLRMTTQAGSGHPTSALSAADIVAALFFSIMNFDPKDPYNPNNDRFILSKGHASPVLYAVWKELGVLTEKDLMTYRHFDSVLEGHPTPRFSRSEAATGSLGQGLSIGAGMALSARLDALDFHTYVLLGDSECAEGSVWEAAELAAYYKLNNLIAFLDCNRLGQSTQTIEGYNVDDFARKFAAFGWYTLIIDGHDMHEIIEASDQAKKITTQPIIIIAKTIKGYGVDNVENKNGFHGKVFSAEELPGILEHMKQRFSEHVKKPDFNWEPHLPLSTRKKIKSPDKITLDNPLYTIDAKIATRKAYGQALKAVGEKSEDIVSLDAEVKNSTYAEIFEQSFPQRFIQCFVAEQNMVGMAVGLTSRGKIPFASTFAVFFSRAFDQIRMAAVGKAPLRLVGSHAGVSIGQDGPSQMGLEDIAMMRSVYDSVILYPCDAVSTYKLVELMANHHTSISYLRTTRSDTRVIYASDAQFKIGGCSIIQQTAQDHACIVAAGITVHEALKAYEKLAQENIFVTVIDLYSIKPLDASTLLKAARKASNIIITVEDHYREGGIGEAVESALKNTGISCYSLAVTKLPHSGKPEELLSFEGIDARAIIQCVKENMHT